MLSIEDSRLTRKCDFQLSLVRTLLNCALFIFASFCSSKPKEERWKSKRVYYPSKNKIFRDFLVRKLQQQKHLIAYFTRNNKQRGLKSCQSLHGEQKRSFFILGSSQPVNPCDRCLLDSMTWAGRTPPNPGCGRLGQTLSCPSRPASLPSWPPQWAAIDSSKEVHPWRPSKAYSVLRQNRHPG